LGKIKLPYFIKKGLKMKKIIFLILFIINMNVFADGGQPFSFLKNGVGVRATAMGKAFTAVANDVSSIYYNPAGLLRLNDLELTAETYLLSFGRNMNYIAIGKPFELNKNVYASGFSWINFSSGDDIEERITNSDSPESKFSNSANLFIFSTATQLIKDFYVGGNFKFLFQNIKDVKGSGIGFDLGVFIKLFDNFNAGFTIQNISTNVNWSNTSHIETLPQYFLCGISYEFSDTVFDKEIHIIPAFDFIYTSPDYYKIGLGFELTYNKFVSIRVGYNDTFSAGFGLNIQTTPVFSIKLDYTFLNDLILKEEFNHRLGITFDYVFPHWGKVEKREEDKEKKEDNDEW